MKISQMPECMDFMLHNEFGDDYPYQVSLNDTALLLGEVISFLQQANLTVGDLDQLEKEYNERYDSKISQKKQTNEITW